MVLGPLTFFFTWWGECFAETCPSPTVIDDAAYLFDLVAGWSVSSCSRWSSWCRP